MQVYPSLRRTAMYPESLEPKLDGPMPGTWAVGPASARDLHDDYLEGEFLEIVNGLGLLHPPHIPAEHARKAGLFSQNPPHNYLGATLIRSSMPQTL